MIPATPTAWPTPPPGDVARFSIGETVNLWMLTDDALTAWARVPGVWITLMQAAIIVLIVVAAIFAILMFIHGLRRGK